MFCIFFFCIAFKEKEKVEFSETVDSYDDKLTFQDMNVSRPLMKVGKRVTWYIDLIKDKIPENCIMCKFKFFMQKTRF